MTFTTMPAPRTFVAAAACLLLATAAGVEPSGAQRAAPDVIRVRTLPNLSYALLHLAREEGLFARENLRVEFVELDTTVADVPPLMRGDLDVLPTVLSPALFNAVARGGRLRIVAGQHQLGAHDCPYMGVVARPALAAGALDTPAGLKGRRIAVPRAHVTQFLLDRLLGATGVARADLTEVDVPDALRGEALAAGRIDLAVLSEPWLTRARLAGQGVIWKGVDEAAPGLPYTAVLYGPTLLDRRPEVGHRFMTAYLHAVRRMAEGRTRRNVDVLAAATGLDRDLVERACWPSARADGRVDAAGIQAFQAWALAQGLVDRVLPAAQLIDDRFASRASGTLPGGRP